MLLGYIILYYILYENLEGLMLARIGNQWLNNKDDGNNCTHHAGPCPCNYNHYYYRRIANLNVTLKRHCLLISLIKIGIAASYLVESCISGNRDYLNFKLFEILQLKLTSPCMRYQHFGMYVTEPGPSGLRGEGVGGGTRAEMLGYIVFQNFQQLYFHASSAFENKFSQLNTYFETFNFYEGNN